MQHALALDRRCAGTQLATSELVCLCGSLCAPVCPFPRVSFPLPVPVDVPLVATEAAVDSFKAVGAQPLPHMSEPLI